MRFERTLTRQELMQNDAERVNVAPRIRPSALQLFRRDVAGRAGAGAAGSPVRIGDAGQTKVCESYEEMVEKLDRLKDKWRQ